MSMIKVNNLTYSYDQQKTVLKDVNLTFERGTSYSIVGKSGSGKSTLLSLISGLDKIQDGEIIYEGKSLKEYDIDEYRAQKVGIIFQRYNLLNNYSVQDNIYIAMNIAGQEISEAKAIELLEKVGLDKSMMSKMPLQLSGGQQQRVAIARTLAKNCDVLIADEPTGNLDSDTELEILQLLIDLVKTENKTLIVVTHSNVIAENTEHVYGITDGTVNAIK